MDLNELEFLNKKLYLVLGKVGIKIFKYFLLCIEIKHKNNKQDNNFKQRLK